MTNTIYIQAPRWCPDAVPSSTGWKHPVTGELLVSVPGGIPMTHKPLIDETIGEKVLIDETITHVAIIDETVISEKELITDVQSGNVVIGETVNETISETVETTPVKKPARKTTKKET